MSLVVLDKVHKSYGNFNALNGVTYKIEKGEIVTLLGPNGAGKTTTVGMLLGLIRPTSGEIKLFGLNPSLISSRIKLGATPQDSHFPENARVDEVVNLIASHYKAPRESQSVLEQFGVSSISKKKISELSGGQRRCVSLACAFVGDPELVLLDEPTTGLDVDVRRNLWTQVKKFREQGGSVLLTTHYLEEAEAVSDRVIVMYKGQVIQEGSPEEIRTKFGAKKITFKAEKMNFESPKIEFNSSLDRYELTSNDSDSFVKNQLSNTNFTELEIQKMSLEEIFLKIIGEQKGK